jgi:hypothetical protein
MGSNPDIYQKYKMGDISKEVTNKLYPAKNIQKGIGRRKVRKEERK